MTSQRRISAGNPTGGQFAAAPRSESDVTLDASPRTPLPDDRRFESSGLGRAHPPVPYRHGQPYYQERRAAAAHLDLFRTGEVAVVTDERGREFTTRITGPSWTSGHSNPGVSATLGPGRYTFAVDPHRLATGSIGIRKATLAEEAAFNEAG